MDEIDSNKKRPFLSPGNMPRKRKKKKKHKVQRGGVLNECYKDETTGKIHYKTLTKTDSIQVQQVPMKDDDDTRSLRIIPPYPYLFSTFAKDRWIGKSILTVYTHEFGTYPKCYYERAISDGLIFVNQHQVSVEYQIQRGDELCHVIHRHEPPVLMTMKDDDDNHGLIVYEDEHVMAVDKVPTIPIHPCGAYHFNTLLKTLPTAKNDVYPIHRLDRLTSGIVVLAKSKQVATSLSSYFLQQQSICHKYYLARVHGQFPTSLTTIFNQTNKNNNYYYWIQTNTGKRSSLDAYVTSPKHSIVSVLQGSHEEDESILWLYVNRSIRPSSFKDGTWNCCDNDDADGKAAKTAFGIVSYDQKSNTTLVIAKPITGRTHQIRLHLQYLGHSIINDDLYPQQTQNNHTTTYAPNHVPVTIQDVQNMMSSPKNTSSNNLLQHVQQSCVWCAKEKEQKKNIVDNFLLQNQGIYLHALKYHMINWIPPNSTNNIPKDLNLYTKVPIWAREHSS